MARRHLAALADADYARGFQRFFKTGPGEYGEGDRFHGIKVPPLRLAARQFHDLPHDEVKKLLDSPMHEERLLALLIWVGQFRRGKPADQKRIYQSYLAATRRINNWDLVDSSAEHIVGAYLFERSRAPLARLARSKSLWERRIAIIATFHFIRRGEFSSTIELAERLLADQHDLIHKAVGWMLREVGKRDEAVLRRFLDEHRHHMPRTALRYAIERFAPSTRAAYLAR